MMRIGDQRPMKDGRTFTMTSARRLANGKAADKRRGVRFVELKVHANCHPIVRQFIAILNRERITLTSVAARAGLERHTLAMWRVRRNPNLVTLEAALNAIGYELRVTRARDEAPASNRSARGAVAWLGAAPLPLFHDGDATR